MSRDQFHSCALVSWSADSCHAIGESSSSRPKEVKRTSVTKKSRISHVRPKKEVPTAKKTGRKRRHRILRSRSAVKKSTSARKPPRRVMRSRRKRV